MDQNYIDITALELNGVSLGTGCQKRVGCDNLIIAGTYWRTPIQDAGGIVIGYNDVLTSQSASTTVPPSADSFKVVKASSGGNFYTALIGNLIDGSVLQRNCNICCGVAPAGNDIITNLVPPNSNTAIIGCIDASGNYNYYFPIPDTIKPAGSGATFTVALSGTTPVVTVTAGGINYTQGQRVSLTAGTATVVGSAYANVNSVGTITSVTVTAGTYSVVPTGATISSTAEYHAQGVFGNGVLGALAAPTLSGSSLVAGAVTTAGVGYTQGQPVTFTGGTFTVAGTGYLNVNPATGAITSVTITGGVYTVVPTGTVIGVAAQPTMYPSYPATLNGTTQANLLTLVQTASSSVAVTGGWLSMGTWSIVTGAVATTGTVSEGEPSWTEAAPAINYLKLVTTTQLAANVVIR